nr:MAG TPA: hypothetical protein [Caudoviricetes sp.]
MQSDRCRSWQNGFFMVSQKNAADRLLHAFPAMIAARWSDTNDYLSNRRAK